MLSLLLCKNDIYLGVFLGGWQRDLAATQIPKLQNNNNNNQTNKQEQKQKQNKNAENLWIQLYILCMLI